jgi:hypothetical protein
MIGDLAVRRCRSAVPRRGGATILELLVAASVLSFLMALILPAIGASRESARRAQCAGRLHQMIVASQAHAAARRAFPYTSIGFYYQLNGPFQPPVSPHALLLPYLEAQPIFAEINFDDNPFNISQFPPASIVNTTVLKQTVPVFLCPSDSPQPGANSYRACLGPGVGVFAADVGASCVDPGNGTGAFVNGRSVNPAEFLDGLSHTIMFSEKPIGSGGAYRPWSDYLISPIDLCTADAARAECATLSAGGLYDRFGGTTWLLGGWRQTWYNHVLPPNTATPDCNAGAISNGGGPGVYAARSYHPTGVNAANADGAVQFVSQSIDAAVWRALSTRRGADAINAPF